MELKQLSIVGASYNQIIDTESIQLHPNFDKFNLDVQYQPTTEDLKAANIMRDINNQISSLKYMCQQSSHTKNENNLFRQKITQKLQQSYNSHEQFVARVTFLFQKMNELEGQQ
ncbi:Hypothetical_protein [Hexamita inflata]|uniref:Hypothetical_protein n=1 Tax=Hexamita inflata TaxID=28002 RepID=A0AA86N6D3_9EUKA|nr:Hypothetical protein HINF_LOCUS1482 [Hexamita inflata]